MAISRPGNAAAPNLARVNIALLFSFATRVQGALFLSRLLRITSLEMLPAGNISNEVMRASRGAPVPQISHQQKQVCFLPLYTRVGCILSVYQQANEPPAPTTQASGAACLRRWGPGWDGCDLH
jgi:hypothetical protein